MCLALLLNISCDIIGYNMDVQLILIIDLKGNFLQQQIAIWLFY